MNDATKAKFAAILAAQQAAAANSQLKKSGQPAAPKQPAATPQPTPAPAAVVKSKMAEFTIIWHEGTGEFEGQTFYTWYDANKAMTEICRAHGYSQGYSKVKICVKWENREEMTDRADCGKHSSGDFDSDREKIGQYLERSRQVVYARTFSSREGLSFEDAPEVEKAAIIAEQAAAAKKDMESEAQMQDKTTAPELSTLTSADLIGSTPAPVYCAPVAFALPAMQQSQPAPQPTAVAAEVKKVKFSVVDYSEKAFAVIAENNDAQALRKIQADMYNLSGKYNAYLKCGAGYIFSKRHLAAVQDYFKAK